MRHDQPQRITMLRRERLAVMVCGKEHVVTIKIDQRNVSGETLFGMDKYVLRLWLEFYQLKNFLKCDTLPVIVKAAPARDAMEIAVRFDFGQFIEFVPFEPDRLVHKTSNIEVPTGGIKAWH